MSFCILCAAAVPLLGGGILTQEEERRSHLPAWVILKERETACTIHAAAGTECISLHLHGGALTLAGAAFRFETDSTWLTADCLVFDADHDGFDEVLLHVWKPGSFGTYQPFWRDPDNKTLYSEHLFLYEWDTARPDRLDPKWMSSAMPVFGREVTAAPDGTICVIAPDDTETYWRWEGWGLVKVQKKGEIS